MANFNLTITNEGAAFLADVIANQGTINFSEVRFSSTNYVGSEAGLTEGTFGGTFITVTPSASVLDGTTINIEASFTNTTFSTDKTLYSIGIIADDGNGTDYLVAVATTSAPDTLPKYEGSASTYAYNINLGVSSTNNITVTASTAGVVYVADIVDDLTSSATNKPLSAKQGQVLKQDKTEKTDLTSIIATGSTNTTGAQIPNGAYFYLNGVFCRAIADIAANATFTQNTNYKEMTISDAFSQMLDINNAWPTLTQSTNWNDATKTGMYYMNTWAGSGGSNYFPVQTAGVCLILNPGGNIIQLVFAREVFGIRTYNASQQTWGSWTKVSLY